MTCRHRLICLALRLQWPPFIWLFRLYYWLAIQCSKILIGRLAGVRSLYLTGSWTHGNIIYGLSDLDFKVLVAGTKNQFTYAAIRRRFLLLSRLFPMLGSPDEKGIYFLDTFESDYRHYPLIQHLFDARFFRHRLLCGEDLMSRLPIRDWKELDQGECAFARIKDWIEKIYILADYDGFSSQQKQHLFFKAVCDITLLSVRMKSPQCQPSHRIEILKHTDLELEAPYRQWTENLILENQSFYANQRNSFDDDFQLFKKMVMLCCQKISAMDGALSSSMTFEPLSGNILAKNNATADTLGSFSPGILEVQTFHWPALPLNPFDMHLLEMPVYLLKCSRPLCLNEFLKLKAFCRQKLKNRAAVMMQEYPGLLSSVDSDLVDHWGSFPGSSDMLSTLLTDGSRQMLTQMEKTRIEARMRTFRDQLSDTLRHPEFGRLSLSVFALFLFNALRVLIFAHEFNRGQWRWLVEAAAIADFLSMHTPLKPSFLQRLLAQFVNARRKDHHFDERLLPKSRALMNEMIDIVQNGDSWQSLETINDLEDEKRLSISVAIITANRPMQLKRCIKSINRLDRLPEELIIVHDGKDSVDGLALGNSDFSFPVHYLVSPKAAVAEARNAAAATAKGEIIAFIDDDICVESDWLERLERVFLRDPKIGMASGSILNLKSGRKDITSKYMDIVEKL